MGMLDLTLFFSSKSSAKAWFEEFMCREFGVIVVS